MANLWDDVEGAAERTPDAVAIETFDEGALSYAELVRRTASMAQALRLIGLARGARLLSRNVKSTQSLLLHFACVRSGILHVPSNPQLTPTELRVLIADLRPDAVVLDADARDALPASSQVRCLSEITSLAIACGDTPAPICDVADADIAAVMYTSGTTGRPKGAMLSHGSLRFLVATLARQWRFTADDRLLHVLPAFHGHGLFLATYIPLFAGASVDFRARFEVEDVLARLPAATVLMAVPTMYARLANHVGLAATAATRARLFVSGSAALPRDVLERFQARMGQIILERYGSTETGIVASNPYEGERRPSTVGRPLPGVEVRILREDGTVAAPGEIGRIVVRSPGMFSGYLNQDDEAPTGSDAPTGFFDPGDLGFFDADGYLHIAGRAKDLVITGGMNVYPMEVENALLLCEGVAEAAVFGLPHPDYGEAVAAAIVPTAGSRVEVERLRQQLRGRLAAYKVPKVMFPAESLPRNAMGKVDKKELVRSHLSNIVPPASPS